MSDLIKRLAAWAESDDSNPYWGVESGPFNSGREAMLALLAPVIEAADGLVEDLEYADVCFTPKRLNEALAALRAKVDTSWFDESPSDLRREMEGK